MPDYNSLDYILYPTKAEFPETGASETIYYDESEDSDWVWDDQDREYKAFGGDRPNKPPRIP